MNRDGGGEGFVLSDRSSWDLWGSSPPTSGIVLICSHIRSGNQTGQRKIMENPLHIEGFIGKIISNLGVSSATFDCQRVMACTTRCETRSIRLGIKNVRNHNIPFAVRSCSIPVHCGLQLAVDT